MSVKNAANEKQKVDRHYLRGLEEEETVLCRRGRREEQSEKGGNNAKNAAGSGIRGRMERKLRMPRQTRRGSRRRWKELERGWRKKPRSRDLSQGVEGRRWFREKTMER